MDKSGTRVSSMSEFDEVKAAARSVLDALRAHAPDSGYTALVEEAMFNVEDPARRLEAVKAPRGLAHPKALGDLYLQGIPGFEWLNMVSHLAGAAGSYIRKFDPNAATGR